jgi:hypothetical protein
VSKASKPTSVELSGEFEDGVANVTLGDKLDVDCVVSAAKPKPVIRDRF